MYELINNCKIQSYVTTCIALTIIKLLTAHSRAVKEGKHKGRKRKLVRHTSLVIEFLNRAIPSGLIDMYFEDGSVDPTTGPLCPLTLQDIDVSVLHDFKPKQRTVITNFLCKNHNKWIAPRCRAWIEEYAKCKWYRPRWRYRLKKVYCESNICWTVIFSILLCLEKKSCFKDIKWKQGKQ